MSNNYRYRYGETNPASQAFFTSAIAISDALYEDTGNSNKLRPASDFTFASGAIATPSAPTVADGAVAIGTGLANSATGVKVSYNFPWGEGALSNAGSATPTAGAAIVLTGVDLSAVAPALSLNVYVETSAGSGTYKLWGVIYGAGKFLITGYGKGQAPPGSTAAQTALAQTQYSFAQVFMGLAAQATDGTSTFYGVKDGKLRFDTAGVFEMDTASASYNVGDLVGLDNNSGALFNQQVVAVSHRSLAIGRVWEATSSQTKVKVQIFPRGSSLLP